MFPVPEVKLLTDDLLAHAQRDGVTLFGAGNFARDVAKALLGLGVPVHAYVVSNPSVTAIDGISVTSLDGLSESLRALPMFLAVFNHRPESDFGKIAAACHANRVSQCYFPQAYFELIAESVGWRYWMTDRRNYNSSREQIVRAFEVLEDDESRRQFLDTLSFRLGASGYTSPSPCSDPQYFSPAVLRAVCLKHSAVFVDGGAYDGDTIVQAAAALPLSRAYGFEPDIANFSRLTGNIASLEFPVVCYPCGLSNQMQWLAFANNNGEASAVVEDGNNHIQCVRLDDCLVGERIDYIKLDIEGHELAALTGASGIIARDRPVLAIAAYHRWDDLWRIPDFIRRLVPEYRIIYRTHEYNTFESVFYAYC